MAMPCHWLWVTHRQPRWRRAVQAHGQRSWPPLRRLRSSQIVSTRHKLLPCALLPRGLRRNLRWLSGVAPPRHWEAMLQGDQNQALLTSGTHIRASTPASHTRAGGEPRGAYPRSLRQRQKHLAGVHHTLSSAAGMPLSGDPTVLQFACSVTSAGFYGMMVCVLPRSCITSQPVMCSAEHGY